MQHVHAQAIGSCSERAGVDRPKGQSIRLQAVEFSVMQEEHSMLDFMPYYTTLRFSGRLARAG